MNVTSMVPMVLVSRMERSLRFYVDGLGFSVKNQWLAEGKMRWCRLELGGAVLMIQEFGKTPPGKLGEGVSLWIQCDDAIAIYRDVTSRGIQATEPQVGNAMWDTRLDDPDGYRLHFVSPTDVPEETKLAQVKG